MKLYRRLANNKQKRPVLYSLATEAQSFVERVVVRRSFQISAFILFLAVTLAAAFLAAAYLNVKEFRLYGYSGIFLVNLISSATILVPIPGEAVNIAASSILNPLFVGLVASIGAALGEPTSYLAGRWGRSAIAGNYLEKHKQAELWLKRYGAFAIFLFALLPFLIFDLIGFAAGAFKYPLWKFILFCWLGRIIRSLLEAYLGWGAFSFLQWHW